MDPCLLWSSVPASHVSTRVCTGSSCAERISARQTVTKGMEEVCTSLMPAMVDQARAFAAVLGKLDMGFVAEEAEDEIVEALETANVERFESELAEELAAFKPAGK